MNILQFGINGIYYVENNLFIYISGFVWVFQ